MNNYYTSVSVHFLFLTSPTYLTTVTLLLLNFPLASVVVYFPWGILLSSQGFPLPSQTP
jgi:hypothetical protein